MKRKVLDRLIAYTCRTGQRWTAEQTVAYRSRGCVYLFSPAKMNGSCLRMPRPSKLEAEDGLLQVQQDLRLAALMRVGRDELL